VEVPIETLQENFGRLFIELDDPAEFAVYEPFVRNLTGTIALWLESQARRRRLEATLEELADALHSREAILAMVSHDLANPLNAISNMVAALKLGGDLGPHRTALDVIERSTGRMTRMIRDLLDLTNIDSGRLSIERAPHDLGQLLGQALDELRPVATDKAIAVEASTPDDLPRVACDGCRIVQVLGNLLGNALKFTPRGGAVKALVERRGAEVVLVVEDTGPGIPDRDLPHVFERFYRSGQSRERGSGLGLAIAKAIVELHGGRIGVESKPTAGSRFFFTLPA
jgi:signal transduction histidine kinase